MLYSYVGIDLAWKSGAIVVLDQDWKITKVIVPEFPISNRIVWKKIDNKLPALKNWKAAIEKVPKSGILHQTTYYVELMENNKLFNYIAGYVSGVIAEHDNSPFNKLELISPNKWNRNLTNVKQRDQIKEASLNFFKEQEPSWYERYQYDDNLSDIADAYCIAYFGVKNSLRKNFYENQERDRKPNQNNRNKNIVKETKQRPTRQVKRVQRNS